MVVSNSKTTMSSQAATKETEHRGSLSKRSVASGAVGGVIAAVGGYLVAYLAYASEVESQLRGVNFIADLFGGEPIPSWVGVGWLHYNGHFVETQIESFGGTRSVNFITQADGSGLTALYLLAPLMLVLVGAAVAYYTAVESPREGATVGSTVAIGYFIFAAVGVALLQYESTAGSIQPDPITALLLAGIVYPLVFGAIGGAVAGTIRE